MVMSGFTAESAEGAQQRADLVCQAALAHEELNMDRVIERKEP
jgi:hypothetical protein